MNECACVWDDLWWLKRRMEASDHQVCVVLVSSIDSFAEKHKMHSSPCDRVRTTTEALQPGPAPNSALIV